MMSFKLNNEQSLRFAELHPSGDPKAQALNDAIEVFNSEVEDLSNSDADAAEALNETKSGLNEPGGEMVADWRSEWEQKSANIPASNEHPPGMPPMITKRRGWFEDPELKALYLPPPEIPALQWAVPLGRRRDPGGAEARPADRRHFAGGCGDAEARRELRMPLYLGLWWIST